MTFHLLACQFHLSARRVIRFPPGMAGNVLRGALGNALRVSAGPEGYQRTFEPSQVRGPSGLRNSPRPFVLRCAALDGCVIHPGQQFCFGIHLFDSAPDPYERAFAQWADVVSMQPSEVAIDLSAPCPSARRLRVDFLTPTELKGGEPNHFAPLFARARDRVSTLRGLYGAGPLPIDFPALTERARQVKTLRSELRPVVIERRSRRTGQRHGIGGWVGFAEFEGDLGALVPYLEAACWTGVGRHCAWGNGHIAISLSG